ncbi:MAG: hypothetical protein KatS3mg101_0456 [Patescibacteria group bacterium]|nr:MAG: hypothetical protein KatS3mg101_0456 [Patescibacteria group bacterium]
MSMSFKTLQPAVLKKYSLNSRKYKLGLYLTHQFTAQLPEELLKSVFGNVGTIIAFSLGAPDARELANEFAPYFNAEDIISPRKISSLHEAYERWNDFASIFGSYTSTLGADFPVPKTPNRERVIQRSREKYGVSA